MFSKLKIILLLISFIFIWSCGDKTKKISKIVEVDMEMQMSNAYKEGYFELKYENSLIGTQRNLVNVFESDLTDIYNSRTFCLFDDIEKLKEMGLAQGGSLDNAIVVKDNDILNEEGLRNKKEFVNHKILDCMGDLYLTGYKIIGKIVCSQGGHKLTNQLLRKVFQQDENFSLIEITEKHLPNKDERN